MADMGRGRYKRWRKFLDSLWRQLRRRRNLKTVLLLAIKLAWNWIEEFRDGP